METEEFMKSEQPEFYKSFNGKSWSVFYTNHFQNDVIIKILHYLLKLLNIINNQNFLKNSYQ
jgi:hypothetical protein